MLFTKQFLITKLVDLDKLLGRNPIRADLKGSQRSDFPSASTYEKYFGTWNHALVAAGLNPNPRGIRRGGTRKCSSNGYKKTSRETLIRNLQDISESLGRPVTYRDMNEIAKGRKYPGVRAYKNRFGSWSAALREAGIPPANNRRRKETLKNPFANLRMRFEILKRDNFTCQYCGRTPQDGARLVIDHKLAVVNGGVTNISNLITSCFECNAGKSDILLSTHRPRQRTKNGTR